MTRETKLGLAVAASFLALVGGVLAVKLHQGGLTPPDSDAAWPRPRGAIGRLAPPVRPAMPEPGTAVAADEARGR